MPLGVIVESLVCGWYRWFGAFGTDCLLYSWYRWLDEGGTGFLLQLVQMVWYNWYRLSVVQLEEMVR